MQRKEKLCKSCGEMKFLFSKGRCKYCTAKEDSKPIPKVSEKEEQRLEAYSVFRDGYLTLNRICEVCKEAESCDIHHRQGRRGMNLFKDFLAVCRACHEKIHLDPEWAMANYYIISQIKK